MFTYQKQEKCREMIYIFCCHASTEPINVFQPPEQNCIKDRALQVAVQVQFKHHRLTVA